MSEPKQKPGPKRKTSPRSMYIQETFLRQAVRNRTSVVLYLSSRARLVGRILRFDQYPLLFLSYERQLLIFRHAITSIKVVAKGEEKVFKLSKRTFDKHRVKKQ